MFGKDGPASQPSGFFSAQQHQFLYILRKLVIHTLKSSILVTIQLANIRQNPILAHNFTFFTTNSVPWWTNTPFQPIISYTLLLYIPIKRGVCTAQTPRLHCSNTILTWHKRHAFIPKIALFNVGNSLFSYPKQRNSWCITTKTTNFMIENFRMSKKSRILAWFFRSLSMFN